MILPEADLAAAIPRRQFASLDAALKYFHHRLLGRHCQRTSVSIGDTRGQSRDGHSQTTAVRMARPPREFDEPTVLPNAFRCIDSSWRTEIERLIDEALRHDDPRGIGFGDFPTKRA